jgi:uncharacterized phiE125 gp8 family phage protein
MLSGEPANLPAEVLAETRVFLRVDLPDEDALVTRLGASALSLCEQFTRQMLIARDFEETLAASAAWQRLAAGPVRSIAAVEALAVDGTATALASDAYAIDIDANGDGWVRLLQPGEGRIRVSYAAGMAADWSDVPEALRQGIIRLAAHFYAHRDAAEEAGPPAVVTALWRPWRRMRLG